MKQWESDCDGIAGSGRGLKLMRSSIEWFKFSNVCNISHLKKNLLFPLCGLTPSGISPTKTLFQSKYVRQGQIINTKRKMA